MTITTIEHALADEFVAQGIWTLEDVCDWMQTRGGASSVKGK